MMNFSYYNPTRLVLGKGVESEAGEYVRRYGGTKVLLHYGGGSIKKNGVYDRVVASLKAAGIPFVELGGVKPNPRLSLVREGIALCKKENVDFILAVGGGSAIDSSKAIGVGVVSDFDVWDCFIDKAEITAMLPLGAVLTIPAAGSESSTSMVITNEDGWYKRGSGNEYIIPKFALINPETNFTLPPYQTACGCSDILAHLMERYFTNVENVDFTDRLLEASMRTVLYNAPLAIAEPNNYDVRAEINFVGSIAHNNLLNSGRIGDWGSHNIEHELSAAYDVAHGAGLAVVFPAWMKYVYKHDINRFIQFAVRVLDVDFAFAQKDRMVLEAIHRLENFYRAIGMPVRLSELGIGEDRLREMAEKAVVHKPTLGEFVKLGADDIYNVLKLAL